METDLLRLHLSVAVPLKIAEMQCWPELPPMTPAQQQEAGLSINEHILFQGAPGQTTAAINALVGALARLAFQPGGVDFAGLHFAPGPLFRTEATCGGT